MYVITVEFTIHPEHLAAFMPLMLENARISRETEPGCRRFDVLVQKGGAVDRQATLRGAIDWSWNNLSPSETSALAQLSVFRGGFDAAHLIDGDNLHSLINGQCLAEIAREIGVIAARDAELIRQQLQRQHR